MVTFSKKANTILTAMMFILLAGITYNCSTAPHEEANSQSLFSKYIELPNELVVNKTTRGATAESSALAQQISTLWDQANRAYTSNNYTQAVDILKQIEEMDAAFETQSESSFYYALGNAQLKQGNAEAAQRAFANVTSGELTEDAVWKRALSLLAVEEERDNASAAMQSIANSSHAKSSLAENIMYEMSNMSAAPTPVINIVGASEGTIPFTVTFNSNGSTSSSPIISYFWNLGDGSTANGTSVTHTYYKPGIYTIALVVLDAAYQGGSAEVQIAVSAPKGHYELSIPGAVDDVTIQVGSVLNEPTLQTGLNKESYLKFSTVDVFGTITKTEMELSYEGVTAETGNIQAYEGSTTVWNEGSITATNAPTKGALISEQNRTYQLGDLVRWNMHSTAKEVITVVLSTNSNQSFVFGSSEYYFEDGKPKMVVQVDNTAEEGQFTLNPPAPPAPPRYFEAECATVGGNWVRKTNMLASENAYLLYPGTQQIFNTPPTQNSKIVKFSFYLTQEATYDVYTRALLKNNVNNSFWVRIDGANWMKFSDVPRSPAFRWVHVHDNNNGGNTVTHTFSPGIHSIDIAVMEDGTQLDKLGLFSVGMAPFSNSDKGPSSENCSGGTSSDNETGAIPLGSSRDATTATTYGFDYQQPKNMTEELEIFPNPFFSEVTLDMAISSEEVDVRVFDISGQLMIEHLNVDPYQKLKVGNELANGNYIVHVSSDSDVFYKKIQKIAE